jgi:hypothetical protein
MQMSMPARFRATLGRPRAEDLLHAAHRRRSSRVCRMPAIERRLKAIILSRDKPMPVTFEIFTDYV